MDIETGRDFDFVPMLFVLLDLFGVSGSGLRIKIYTGSGRFEHSLPPVEN